MRRWRGNLSAVLPVAGIVALAGAWAILHPQGQVVAALARHADQLRSLASSHPVAALILFVLIYAAAIIVMLPIALIMIFAGGYILGAASGGLGSIAGATLGAVVVFLIARLSPQGAADRLKTRFPRFETVRADFAGRPFRYILSMRLMPLTPFTPVSIAAGLNRLRIAPFVLGTALGVTPECLVYAAVGAGLARGGLARPGFLAAQLHQPLAWLGLAALALAAVLVMRVGRRREVR